MHIEINKKLDDVKDILQKMGCLDHLTKNEKILIDSELKSLCNTAIDVFATEIKYKSYQIKFNTP